MMCVHYDLNSSTLVEQLLFFPTTLLRFEMKAVQGVGWIVAM